MRIKMISMAFTPNGVFDKGQVLTEEQYGRDFLVHLVESANAAEYLDYESKIDMEYEPVKKPLSSQSLPPAKVSRKKTQNMRKKKRK